MLHSDKKFAYNQLYNITHAFVYYFSMIAGYFYDRSIMEYLVSQGEARTSLGAGRATYQQINMTLEVRSEPEDYSC